MTKRTSPKLVSNSQASPSTSEVERISTLVSKTADFLEDWLVTLKKETDLDTLEALRKKILIGEKPSLLDAIVDLGNLAIKCDECRSRKVFADVLDEEGDELGADDREILRRYLDHLSAPDRT